MEHFDFIVLGGGTAGLSASTQRAAAHKRTALIDPGPMGGLCALKGCNPKKILVHATQAWQETRASAEHGVHCADCGIDWPAVIAHKHRFTDPVPSTAEAKLKDTGVVYIPGAARFTAPDRLTVEGRSPVFRRHRRRYRLTATGLRFPVPITSRPATIYWTGVRSSASSAWRR